ncbi:MAG: hypothetical protein LBT88_06655 [Oscillospiraceae bacterium]|nr:hypothetical protein [Oscillospiraceae bacterium]
MQTANCKLGIRTEEPLFSRQGLVDSRQETEAAAERGARIGTREAIAGDEVRKEKPKLIYRIHNPNTDEETAAAVIGVALQGLGGRR